MNFKSVLGFAALALFGMSNAIPVNTSDSKFDYINEKCRAISGIPLLQEQGSLTYACLVKYDDNESNAEINPDNSYCFKQDNDILCISSERTNVMACNKEYRFADESSCFQKIRELSNSSNIRLNRPLVSFPDNKKYVITPREDYSDCRNKGGIVVKKEESMYRYICFVPEGKEIGKTHCADFEGKRYCIEENLTSIDFCNVKEYDAIPCLHFIVEYAVENDVLVSNFK